MSGSGSDNGKIFTGAEMVSVQLTADQFQFVVMGLRDCAQRLAEEAEGSRDDLAPEDLEDYRVLSEDNTDIAALIEKQMVEQLS